jgi:hypothetical protein
LKPPRYWQETKGLRNWQQLKILHLHWLVKKVMMLEDKCQRQSAQKGQDESDKALISCTKANCSNVCNEMQALLE